MLYFNSAFVLLVNIPIGIASSAVRLKNCVITVGIKKCKLTIKKKGKKSMTKLLNIIEVLIFQNLIDSYTIMS